MTADPATTLSSVDLLDEAEHARLDEFGNRAVLTGERAGVDPGVVRRPGDPHPGFRGAGMQRPNTDVRGAGRGVESACVAVGRPRGRPGTGCGAAVFAFGRGDCVDSGGAQDWRRLSADRPGTPGGPDRIRACRRRTRRRDHHRRVGRPTRRPGRGGHRRQRPYCCRPTQHTVAGAHSGRYRLPDLHLRYHRCAQGCGHYPPACDSAAGVDAWRPAVGWCVVAVAFVGVRRLGVGDLRRVAARWAVGGGARRRGALTGRPACAVGRRAGQRVESNPFGGRDVVAGRAGRHGLGGRR